MHVFILSCQKNHCKTCLIKMSSSQHVMQGILFDRFICGQTNENINSQLRAFLQYQMSVSLLVPAFPHLGTCIVSW